MERQDRDLAFMLQYENVAWFDGREVRILDRRVYPGKVEFVTCKTHREVTRAIADMVTHSAGPYTAAAMGMALAAHECRDRRAEDQLAWLEDAADNISHARPTTASRMKIITDGCLAAARQAIDAGEDATRAIMDHTVEANNLRYSKVRRTARYLVDMFPDDGTVMTQCFGETLVGMML